MGPQADIRDAERTAESRSVVSEGLDEHWDSALLRIALLVDRPSASQEVHLLRPLRRLRRLGQCALCIWTESEANKRAALGPDWIAEELRRLRPNILFISRYAGVGVETAIFHARSMGVPVVTHLDDYLLEVPPDLGADKVKHHMRPERIAALRASLSGANLLYISTQTLAEKIRASGFSTPIVVSNLQSCVDPDEISRPPHYDPEANDIVNIGYQGTRNHIHDLRMLAPQLVTVMNARPDVTLTLFGTIEPPDELAAVSSRIQRLQPSGDYAAFMARLAMQRWDIGLAPLRELEFNSFRTYTKWTEYSAAGVCVIATDCVVYREVMKDGSGLLVRNNDWTEGLIRLIDAPLVRRDMVDRAQFKLRWSLSLRNQEEQVLSLIKMAIEK